MEFNKAKEILGNKADWELKAMRKALKMLPFFNTEEDNERLEAINTYFKNNELKKTVYPRSRQFKKLPKGC
jgi:hypothetical protein